MPFNGSNGTFTRLYNFVADAAAGIKILASRMDGEMNGIAAGLSNCVTRDGQSPPSADLPMGGKKIVNMGDPTAAGDAATKGYVDGAYLPLAGGTLTGGLTGTTATFSGAITQAGNQVWHAGNFSPSNYAALSGATFTGNVYRDTGFYLSINGVNNPVISLDTNDWIEFQRSSNNFVLFIGGIAVLACDGSGNLSVRGNITANTAI